MGVIQSGLNSAMTATVGAIGLPKMLKKAQVEAGKELQSLADKKYAELQAQKSAENKLAQEETLKSLESIDKSGGTDELMHLGPSSEGQSIQEYMTSGMEKHAVRSDYAQKKYSQIMEQAISQNDPDLYVRAQEGLNVAKNRAESLRGNIEYLNEAFSRYSINKRANQKAVEQSKQMSEIKQHANYSEEDDFNNPYAGW